MVLRIFILFFSLSSFSNIGKIASVRQKIFLTIKEHPLYQPQMPFDTYYQFLDEKADTHDFTEFKLKLWYFLGKIDAYFYLKTREKKYLTSSRNAFLLTAYYGYENKASNNFLRLLGMRQIEARGGYSKSKSQKISNQSNNVNQEVQGPLQDYDDFEDISSDTTKEEKDSEIDDLTYEEDVNSIPSTNVPDSELEPYNPDDVVIEDDLDTTDFDIDENLEVNEVSDSWEQENRKPKKVKKRSKVEKSVSPLGKKFGIGYSFISWQETFNLTNQSTNKDEEVYLSYRAHSLGGNLEFVTLGNWHLSSHLHFLLGSFNVSNEGGAFFEANISAIGATFGLAAKYDIERDLRSFGLGIDMLYRGGELESLQTAPNNYTTPRDAFLGFAPYLEFEHHFSKLGFFTRLGYLESTFYWHAGLHYYLF